MSAAQWNLRLSNEYQAMCAFPLNPLFSWQIAPGEKPPCVKDYLVTYNVKTMVMKDGKLKPQYQTTVRITMPDSPGSAPTVRIVRGIVPYHPNIYTNGNFCLGDMWNEGILWKLLIKIARVLAFDPMYTNPDSPANRDAANDWRLKMSRIRKPYPCGETNFPHPVGY